MAASAVSAVVRVPQGKAIEVNTQFSELLMIHGFFSSHACHGLACRDVEILAILEVDLVLLSMWADIE